MGAEGAREEASADRKPTGQVEQTGPQWTPGPGGDASHALPPGVSPREAGLAATLSRADARTRAAIIGRLQRAHGNAYVQRTVAGLRETPAQRGAGALLVQRQDGDEGATPAREGEGASPAAGASMSVSLSGIIAHPPSGAKYRAGIKGPQVLAIVLRLLVGNQYTPGLEHRVFADLQGMSEVRVQPWMTEEARAGEPMVQGYRIPAPDAPALLRLLRDRYRLTLQLMPGQLAAVEAGVWAHRAWEDLHQPDTAGAIGVQLPEWYMAHGEFLFTRQMAQRGDLLGRYRQARGAQGEAPGDESRRATVEALRDIVAGLNTGARVWEAIREDRRLQTAGLGEVLRNVDRDASLLSDFLNFAHTQLDLLDRAPREHQARMELLERYARYLSRARLGTGEEGVRQRPGTRNAPPLPASLSSSPALQPPLFDAALGTDHTFFMHVVFPDVFEAMGMWGFYWDYLRIPAPQEGRGAAGQAGEAAGQAREATPRPEGTPPGAAEAAPGAGEGAAPAGSPAGAPRERAGEPQWQAPEGWGSVYETRLAQATQYSAADIQRVIGELGPQGVEATTLVAANAILRYAGTVVRTFFEQVFEPRQARHIVFPGPGLYMVRCRATPVTGREAELIRAPSVAYSVVLAQDPNVMAQERVRLAGTAEQRARADIGRLQQSLAQNPDQPELREQLRQIETAVGPVGPMLRSQADDLRRLQRDLERQLAEARASNDYLATRNLESQLADTRRALERLETTISHRGEREPLHRPGATPERLNASFVSDQGQSISLLLETVEIEHSSDRFRYFVSDSTTPRSRADEGTGDTRAGAILAALQAILESAGGYGRGRVSVSIDGEVLTRRIEADAGQLLMEAVENLTTVVSIAAVAAAPFTGGASLSLLLPVAGVGAIPSVYRIVDRAQAGDFEWDLQTAMDIANIAGATVGLTQAAATGLRMVRLGRAMMIVGLGADGLGMVLMGAGIAEQLAAAADLPPGEKEARMMEIVGMAMVQAGVMVGQSLMRRAMEVRGQRPTEEGRLPAPTEEGRLPAPAEEGAAARPAAAGEEGASPTPPAEETPARPGPGGGSRGGPTDRAAGPDRGRTVDTGASADRPRSGRGLLAGQSPPAAGAGRRRWTGHRQGGDRTGRGHSSGPGHGAARRRAGAGSGRIASSGPTGDDRPGSPGGSGGP